MENSNSASSIPCTDSATQTLPTPKSPHRGEQTIDFFALLTESEKNRIKFCIAQAFNEILKKAKVKRILKLQSYVRNKQDKHVLLQFVQDIKQLNGPDVTLTEADCKEIAKVLTYKKYSANEKILDIDDQIVHFSVILNGVVSVTV